jgi:hypothetical protein
MGKIIDRLVELAPATATVIASIFASPLIGSIAGPVTNFVLGKISTR